MPLALVALVLGQAPSVEPGGPPAASSVPSAMVELAWTQRLNEPVDLNLAFRDETGRPVRLRELTHGKPIVLILAYYRCPQLCNLVLYGVLDALRAMPLRIGEDFEVVTVSFDARETAEIAAAKKATHVASLGRPGAEAHWHFLTGDEPQIAKLAESVGFRYAFDSKHDRFDHASGITILMPNGKVSRYLFGIRFSPRDMKLAIVEASAGKVGSLADSFLLFCFHYDAVNGRYSLAVFTIMRLVAGLSVGMIAWFVIRSLRRERNSGAAGFILARKAEPPG